MFSGMLRMSEMARLRLCDLIVRGEPYIEVINSKGGKSRRVYLTDVPPVVLLFMQAERDRRLEAVRAAKPGNTALPWQAPLIEVDVSTLEAGPYPRAEGHRHRRGHTAHTAQERRHVALSERDGRVLDLKAARSRNHGCDVPGLPARHGPVPASEHPDDAV